MEKKIDWQRKLSSRKFWCTVCGAIVPYMVAFGYTENDVTQMTAIIMGTGALIAYIVGEGMVDASYNKDGGEKE